MNTLLYAVEKLRQLYPEDNIHVVSRSALEDAISAAKFAAAYAGGACREKRLMAAATLFYEIITRHPLSDGNKRLATLMLEAFLVKHGFEMPVAYRAAIKVASGEWGLEDVYKWLKRSLEDG